MITRVRDTANPAIERDIEWRYDEIHPYGYLDGWVIRDAGDKAFTQPCNFNRTPIGMVRPHENLMSALSTLGWEPVDG
jgi:hypothetical protein